MPTFIYSAALRLACAVSKIDRDTLLIWTLGLHKFFLLILKSLQEQFNEHSLDGIHFAWEWDLRVFILYLNEFVKWPLTWSFGFVYVDEDRERVIETSTDLLLEQEAIMQIKTFCQCSKLFYFLPKFGHLRRQIALKLTSDYMKMIFYNGIEVLVWNLFKDSAFINR